MPATPTLDLLAVAVAHGLVGAESLPARAPALDQREWLAAHGVGAEACAALAAELDNYRLGAELGGYAVSGLIGVGPTGALYRALQRSMQRDVALKVLPSAYRARSPLAGQLLREARAAGGVNDPCVVMVFDVGEADGRFYMAGEHLPRGALAARLAQARGPLPVAEALAVARDCAGGLAAIAAAGLVHGDINPDTIKLSAEGRAKLDDLGFSRVLVPGPPPALAPRRGRPGYLAPEVALEDGPGGIHADIFALGAVLYEMLTGQRAYKALDHERYVRELTRQEPPDPLAVAPQLDPRIATLVRTAMAQQRGERFADAAALAAALDALRAALAAGPAAPPAARPAGTRTGPIPPRIASAPSAALEPLAKRQAARAPGEPGRGTTSAAPVRARAGQGTGTPLPGRGRRRRGFPVAGLAITIVLLALLGLAGWTVVLGHLPFRDDPTATPPRPQAGPKGATAPAPVAAAPPVPAKPRPPALRLRIDFQPAGARLPDGWLADHGAVFGERGKDLRYGWNRDHSDLAKDRGNNSDPRLATIVGMHAGGVWQVALPDARYEVTALIGDSQQPSVATLRIGGVEQCRKLALPVGEFKAFTATVAVKGGMLAIDQDDGDDKATRLAYVDIQQVEDDAPVDAPKK